MYFNDDQRSGIRINVKGFAVSKPSSAVRAAELRHPLQRRTLLSVLFLGLCLGLATTALVRSSNPSATWSPYRNGASTQHCPQSVTALAAPGC